jgi:hypothetical protein
MTINVRTLLPLILILCSVVAVAQKLERPDGGVTRVETALNHLTVLEFHEPVTMAAAGSPDFQIERQDNKVFVKPTKSGASTDLLVWTASRRFAYELETTEEVKNMNFAIDAAIPAPPPVVSSSADDLADMMLIRAFLGAVEIRNNRRPSPAELEIRVEQVFRTRSTVYVHYTVTNNSESSYHAGSPAVFELKADHSPISLAGLLHTQLDAHALKKIGRTTALPLPIARNESEQQDLQPGASSQGVLAIRQDLTSPTVMQLVLDSDTKATFVM